VIRDALNQSGEQIAIRWHGFSIRDGPHNRSNMFCAEERIGMDQLRALGQTASGPPF
jgi:hypothetical protein